MLTIPAKITIGFVIAAIVTGVALFERVIWAANHMSSEFLSTRWTTLRSIEACDDQLTSEDHSFAVCAARATEALRQLGNIAQSHYERVQYSDLHAYLQEVAESRTGVPSYGRSILQLTRDRIASRQSLEKMMSEH